MVNSVLITGSSRGIGAYLAQHYLARGWTVAGCSRGTATIQDSHYTHYSLDVTDERAVGAMLQDIRQHVGRVDLLVNNAGVAAMNAVLLTPLATAERILHTNVLGTFVLCRATAKLMVNARYGRIVNFGSVAGPLTLAGEALYAASKDAILTFSRVLARELAPYNITCNVVAPTPIDTDLIRGVPAAKLEALLARLASARMGELSDVAHVVDFFADPTSSFITGQVLYLGGV